MSTGTGTPSGSEFAMRIALADLSERLKRTEQTCRYLELCRNELAKELIRVRTENEHLSRDNSLLQASLQSIPHTHVRNSNQINNNHSNVAVMDPNSKHSSSLPSHEHDNEDQDLEEITQQLLEQMRKEVLANQQLQRKIQSQLCLSNREMMFQEEDKKEIVIEMHETRELVPAIPSQPEYQLHHNNTNNSVGSEVVILPTTMSSPSCSTASCQKGEQTDGTRDGTRDGTGDGTGDSVTGKHSTNSSSSTPSTKMREDKPKKETPTKRLSQVQDRIRGVTSILDDDNKETKTANMLVPNVVSPSKSSLKVKQRLPVDTPTSGPKKTLTQPSSQSSPEKSVQSTAPFPFQDNDDVYLKILQEFGNEINSLTKEIRTQKDRLNRVISSSS